jgi:hypothetical protein
MMSSEDIHPSSYVFPNNRAEFESCQSTRPRVIGIAIAVSLARGESLWQSLSSLKISRVLKRHSFRFFVVNARLL